MAGIDVEIKEKIDDRIQQKIKSIGDAAKTSDGEIQKLKASLATLKVGGQNISNIAANMNKNAQAYSRTATQIQIANNRIKISDDNVATNAVLNANKIVDAQRKTAAAIANTNRAAAAAAAVQSRLDAIRVNKSDVLANNSISKSNTATSSANTKALAAAQTKVTQSAVSAQFAIDRLARSYQKNAVSAQAAAQANSAVAAQIAKSQAAASAQIASAPKGPKATAAALNQASVAQANNAVAISQNQLAQSAAQAQLAQLRLAQGLQRQGAAAKVAQTGLAGFFQRLIGGKSAVTGFEMGIKNAAQTIRSFASAYLLFRGLSSGVGSIDAARNLQNSLSTISQVKDARGETDQLKTIERRNELTRQLYEVANRARVPVDSLQNSFRKFDNALKPFGKSQADTIRLVETIAKVSTVSGATPSQTTALTEQLAQAFGSGKLNSDEFRTVKDLLPEFAQSFSEAMNVSIGEMQRMAEAGEITIPVMLKVFDAMQKSADSNIANTVRTIGQAFTQLGNSVQEAFGKLDASVGITDGLNGWIDKVKENLPLIGRGLLLLGATLTGLVAIPVAGWLLAFTTTLPGMITVATLGVALFADKIKVTADGAVTLEDTIIGIGKSIAGWEIPQPVRDFFEKTADLKFDISAATGKFIRKTGQAISAGIATTQDLAPSELFSEKTRERFTTTYNLLEAMKKANPSKTLGQSLSDGLLNAFPKISEVAKTRQELEALQAEQSKPNPDALRQYDAQIAAMNKLGESADKTAGKFEKLKGAQQFWLNEASKKFTPEFLQSFGFSRNDKGNFQQPKDFQAGFGPLNFPKTDSRDPGNKVDLAKPVIDASTSAESAAETLQQSFERAVNESLQSLTTFQSDAKVTFDGVKSNASDSAKGLGSFEIAGSSASQAVSEMADAMISQFNRIKNAAQEAAAATASIGGSSSIDLGATGPSRESFGVPSSYSSGSSGGAFAPGSRFDYLSLPGYAAGGYTGNISRTSVAGPVHGQEFVVNPDATKRNRAVLEAMNAGQTSTASRGASGSGSGAANVTVHNYGGAQVETRQLSDGEIMILIDEKAKAIAHREAPLAVAGQMRNPNSSVSKSLARNTTSQRRR